MGNGGKENPENPEHSWVEMSTEFFSKTFNSFWRFFELSFTEKLFFSDNFHLKIYIGNI